MEQEHILTFGPFRLDTTEGRLWRQETVIPLRPRSVAMLQYLAERPGRLISKAELLQQVWGGAHVSDDVLRASVRDIRRALGDAAAAPQYLETAAGQGYRFLQGGMELLHQSMGPVVGRQRDVERLEAYFGRAVGGERQFVLLSGEPGIGKTTVVELFRARLAARQGLRIAQGQCVLHYGEGEAYHALLTALGRLGQGPDGSEVIPVLQRHAPMWLLQLPALVSGAELERLQRQVQGATQARMVRELNEALEVLTAETPLLLVLEDLHWSDVSTVELLAAMAQRSQPARLLVLGTYRPADAAVHARALRDVVQELRGRGQCHELAIELLDTAEVVAYITGRLGGPVSERLSRLLYERTEGNPLFMVNLVDHLIHQRALVQQDGQWTVRPEVTAAATMVPAGLRPLIMRRLEALEPEARRALEVASVAGTSYPTALVAAGLQQRADAVERRFESLAARGQFIVAAGLTQWPDGTLSGRYRFQHTLYHQVLYEHLSAARRVQLHRRLGGRLEAAYGTQAAERAAELAVHFVQGHDAGRAVQYLQHAADSALQRSAHQEALRHLSTALTLLEALADTPERAQHELRLRLALGATLVVTKGYAAPEVAATYERARALCRHLAEMPEQFQVLWGLWSFDLVRGQLPTAHQVAERCARLAQHLDDPALVLEAHNMLAQTLSYLGEFSQAVAHAEQGVARYDTAQHAALAARYVRDPGVLCLFYKAWNVWFLGHADEALGLGRHALALAQRLSHPFSLVAARYLMAWLHQLRREPAAVHDLAAEVVRQSQEHGFALWAEQGTVLCGWALAVQGQVEAGMAEMRQGLTAYLATGARRAQVSFLLGLVEASLLSGQTASGQAYVTEALQVMNAQGERWCAAELYRLRGELLLQARADSQAHGYPDEDIQACLQQALTVARGQHAKMLQLRAASSLARLWQQHGQHDQARQLLEPLYNWFSEGFDTVDLQTAQGLLEEL